MPPFSESSSYEYRLTAPDHIQRITNIARKQTKGSGVHWQDGLQTAQLKLLVAIRAGKFKAGTERDFDRWAATVARFEIIDLLRKAKRQDWESLDRPLAEGFTVLETIADPFDGLTAIDAADLICAVRAAVLRLDRRYPDRAYYRLWQGKIAEETQAAIAQALGLTQGAVSKRWQELLQRLATELTDLDNDPKKILSERENPRTRSEQQW
jgi:RNA polymerase sigma factor (sigma-70 family)